jgi:FkbM family methyltransferase
MAELRRVLARHFRWTLLAKRYLAAWRDWLLPAKASYSQFGEDVEIDRIIAADITNGIYMDVGANHPSVFSNTYLFYRKGRRGVLIEPDLTACRLLDSFRKGDIVIRALAGENSGLQSFNLHIYPSLSSIRSVTQEDLLKKVYLPQVTLDQVYQAVNPDFVFLLSVDTEGFDLEVLHGAVQMLRHTWLVCVEYEEANREALQSWMVGEQSFDLAYSNRHNLIFKNRLVQLS